MTANQKGLDEQTKETVRASISFPAKDYEELERIALAKRVSLAWLVREAVRLYLENQQALNGNQ